MSTETASLKDALLELENTPALTGSGVSIVDVARRIPRLPENVRMFETCLGLIGRIPDPEERRSAVFEVAKLIPPTGAFSGFFRKINEESICAADLIDDVQPRTTELMRIEGGLPRTPEYLDLRRLAWRLALKLPDRPRNKGATPQEASKDMPKPSDLDFYRRYTLLGIARQLPRTEEFLDIYREAMRLAIDAANVLAEPYYRRYALQYIANELKERPNVGDLYAAAMGDAYRAALSTTDSFTREFALIDVLKETPKTEEFHGLLQEIVDRSLAFFTVRKWMEDIEFTDVVDFMLSAEELGMKESKKRRLLREKYARRLASEIESLGAELNDTRFIATLRPYTHVWVRPGFLRESVKKVVISLEELTRKYHGREIERPVFVSESHGTAREETAPKGAYSARNDSIAIDLGATNTVIMRKRPGSGPDFVVLDEISEHYDNVCVIPTVLSRETNAIGSEVREDDPVADLKQMLLDGNPRGEEHMERFFRILYRHLKKGVVTPGWFSIMQRGVAEDLHITVPVGFRAYRNTMKRIVEKTIRGVRAEFIEEPLAAAIGYEVASERDRLVMIIDFGGSTLNTMLLRLNVAEAHVVAKPERAQVLGGSDIDRWLAVHLAEEAGLKPEDPPYALLTKAERIKIELSRRNEVPFEWSGRQVSTVTREEFERVLDRNDFYSTVDRVVSNVLSRAAKVGVQKNRIEAVLLTGGSSQIPSFREKVEDIFPELRKENRIYDHSPLSAVSRGAALYGTREVTDRHLGMAYAVRYSLDDPETPYSYAIVLEKGENLPLDKTFLLHPARKHGSQKEVYLELFEVPESLIVRRWVTEAGMESIRQDLQQTKDVALTSIRTVTLQFERPIEEDVEVTFMVDGNGRLSVRYGPEGKVLDTGITLQ